MSTPAMFAAISICSSPCHPAMLESCSPNLLIFGYFGTRCLLDLAFVLCLAASFSSRFIRAPTKSSKLITFAFSESGPSGLQFERTMSVQLWLTSEGLLRFCLLASSRVLASCDTIIFCRVMNASIDTGVAGVFDTFSSRMYVRICS